MENPQPEPSAKKKWSLKKRIIVTALVWLGAVSAVGASAPKTEHQSATTKELKPAVSQPITPKVETKQVETKQIVETTNQPFQTVNQNDATLPVGQTQVVQEGKEGTTSTTFEITYTDGVQTAKKLVGEPVIVKPVDKVVKVGMYVKPVAKQSNCDPNYAGACVPIASDVDCGGGSGNGPAYVYGVVTVIGTDIYGLDRDGDGLGCE